MNQAPILHLDESEIDDVLQEGIENEPNKEQEDQEDQVEQNEQNENQDDDPNPIPHHEPEEPQMNEEEVLNEPQLVSDESETESQATTIRRSNRTRETVERMNIGSTQGQSYLQAQRRLEHCHNIVSQRMKTVTKDLEYDETDAWIICLFMREANQNKSFAQQYILQKGLKRFGQAGVDAMKKEMGQLHDRVCFYPISIATLTREEKKKAVEAIALLTEKRDGTVKGRTVYNGKPTREWLSREDSASPTAALESLMLLAVIDCNEERNVTTHDVPNAFIQARIPTGREVERVIMKITGALVDILLLIDPERYGPFVVFDGKKKVIYVQVLRAIYGMLQAALLWYKKFRKDLEEIGFKFNPYDPCVANKMVRGKQHTIRFHVDDLMSSHVDPEVNKEFHAWLVMKYGKIGEVKTHTGNEHDYLGMIFRFDRKKKFVEIDMRNYVKSMLDDFPIKLESGDTAPTPAGNDLFNVDASKLLDEKRKEIFHKIVAKGLFVCKRGRPDVQPTIAYLCTRVSKPNESDWNKLTRLMKYLNGSRELTLKLHAKGTLNVIKWSVDVSFAVHPDFRSHTGMTMKFGNNSGAVQGMSRKQKLNTRSSTESEIVGVDDASVMILWTKLFLEAQGGEVKKNIIYQDNKSAILLEMNGKKSSSQRTRALNIRYFFMTDQIKKGNVMIEYCPTDDMTSDFMTKALQGTKFKKHRAEIMGEE